MKKQLEDKNTIIYAQRAELKRYQDFIKELKDEHNSIGKIKEKAYYYSTDSTDIQKAEAEDLSVWSVYSEDLQEFVSITNIEKTEYHLQNVDKLIVVGEKIKEFKFNPETKADIDSSKICWWKD